MEAISWAFAVFSLISKGCLFRAVKTDYSYTQLHVHFRTGYCKAL